MYNTIVNYYLLSKQFILTNYYKIKTYFEIQEYKIKENNKVQNVLWRYFLFIIFTKVINVIKKIRNSLDYNAEMIQLSKITSEGEKTIILDNKKNSFKDITKIISDIRINNDMVNNVFINFDLVNRENDKICLKNLIMKYDDPENIYNHTIGNILFFNNIEYNADSQLNVKFIKNKKIINCKKMLKDVLNEHINFFYEV